MGNRNGCCRILHCDREDLYLSDFLRLFTIDTISELSTSNDLDLLLQDNDSIYLPLQRKYTPKLRKSKIDISYS